MAFYHTLSTQGKRQQESSIIRHGSNLAFGNIAIPALETAVGSKGDRYDNTLAETINGLYKMELIYPRRPWTTRESVQPTPQKLGRFTPRVWTLSR